jgi:uncharacterized membrane protein YGL010W
MGRLDQHMSRYDHEHHHPWNKFLHGVGIPMIFAGIILTAYTRWVPGAALFVAGWALLFLGHRIEGNKPAFFQGGPVYFLVGPLWVAREIRALISKRPSDSAVKN